MIDKLKKVRYVLRDVEKAEEEAEKIARDRLERESE